MSRHFVDNFIRVMLRRLDRLSERRAYMLIKKLEGLILLFLKMSVEVTTFRDVCNFYFPQCINLIIM